MSSKGLFRLSEAVVLALHAAALLAESEGETVPTSALAKGLQASGHHLAKVLQRLARVGLVEGTRGPGGGFRLSRPAREISLLQVYEAIEGPLVVCGCLFDRPVCDGRFCILGGLVGRLEDQTKRYLMETTLHDVAHRREGGCGG